MSAIIKKAGSVCEAFEFIERPNYETKETASKKLKTRSYGPLVIPAHNILVHAIGENVISYAVHCNDTLGHLMHYMTTNKIVIDNDTPEKREVSITIITE